MQHLIKHLQHELRTHTFDYLLLFTAGVMFLLALEVFKGHRFLEFIILIAFASFYIIWGMYHHILDQSFHLKNIIEYVFIGFIIIFLVRILIFP